MRSKQESLRLQREFFRTTRAQRRKLDASRRHARLQLFFDEYGWYILLGAVGIGLFAIAAAVLSGGVGRIG